MDMMGCFLINYPSLTTCRKLTCAFPYPSELLTESIKRIVERGLFP